MQIFVFFLILVSVVVARADESGFAIIHGSKGAFNISAPKGWVIDTRAGADDGLPCVLFRKGQSWEGADPLMYAKIASAEYKNAEAFAKKAIKEAIKDRGDFAVTRVESGKTKSGEDYFINEYAANEDYPRTERVAYIQMPDAVAYVVFSGDVPALFRKEQGALKHVATTMMVLDPKKEAE